MQLDLEINKISKSDQPLNYFGIRNKESKN